MTSRSDGMKEGDLHFVAAGPDHCDLYFSWANDPGVRANSFDSRPIRYENHAAWFQNQIRNHSVRMYVVEQAQKPVAQIRFVETEAGCWQINFSLDASERGKGLGALVLARGVKTLKQDLPEQSLQVFGLVKAQNISSAKSFLRAGFLESVSGEPDVRKFCMSVKEGSEWKSQ